MEKYGMQFYDTAQAGFDRQARGIGMAGGMFGLVLAFLPLLATGFIIGEKFLTPKDTVWAWLGFIVGAAVLAYGGVTWLWLQAMKMRRRRNPLWILLAVLVLAYTCLPTPLLIHGWAAPMVARWHWAHWVAWVLPALAAISIFHVYGFKKSLF